MALATVCVHQAMGLRAKVHHGLRSITDVNYLKIHSAGGECRNCTGNYRSVYKTRLRPDPPTDHRSQ